MTVERTVHNVVNMILCLPLNLIWRWPKAGVVGLRKGVKGCGRGIRFAFRWALSNARYYAALFLYTSRRFLRLEGYLALAAAIIYFAGRFLSVTPKGGQEILDCYYRILTVGMVLLAMNLLPRERDERTLEILWSQPVSRGGIVFVQILSLTIWSGVLMGLLYILFNRFLSAESYPLWVGLFGLSTAFAVALITVLISTFCRNAVATAIVAALVFGIHFYWLEDLGPINLYFNPIPSATVPAFSPPGADQVNLWKAVFNRLFVLGLLALVFDYLLLRLRNSSPWLT